ncbi:MAG TPA: NAD(P)/FAD-dependent oxidoreductase [Vicinamibacterales bacterium]|nr:NAD(P)/FAD-dependent oxidoreductase [Vicinamibacterales bacterium]
MNEPADAVVVGSGPNGFAAAITLAEAGHEVTLVEGRDTLGGGLRSAELTLPGFIHDVCSAIYPFGRTSPFFVAHAEALERAGVRWIQPPYAIGHPLDDGAPILLERDVASTAAGLGEDADAYRGLMNPLVDHWPTLVPHVLAPFHIPWGPITGLRMARFGWQAIHSASALVRGFRGERARALFAGAAAHSILPLTEHLSAAAGMVMLATAHVDGWPFAAGGAQTVTDGLAKLFTDAGGRTHTGVSVESLDQLPPHRVAVLDVSPRNLDAICGDRLDARYRRALRSFRHGPGVFKLDLAIDGAIPWRDAELLNAGTIHLGGTFAEIARSELDVDRGRHNARPFVLLVQQSNFDRTRAPDGKNVVWAYCHVPNGSTRDMTEVILGQIERFAPGFRDTILATHATTPAELETYNPNYVGGDIAGGRFDLGQLFDRPARPCNPYSTPDPRIYLCSASTPPGAGVHGMCGYHAAHAALKRLT